MKKVFGCPVCGFISLGEHGEIEECDYCGRANLVETKYDGSCLSNEITPDEERKFRLHVFETILEPMGQFDKESREYKEIYANRYGLPEPPETTEYRKKLRQQMQLEEIYRKQDEIEAAKPKCPTCGSKDVHQIGGLERAGSVAMLGLFSNKINKSFKCKRCGYTW